MKAQNKKLLARGKKVAGAKVRKVKVSKSLEKASRVAKVQLLHEGGASQRDIATMLQMSTATVWQYLKLTDETVTALKTTIKRKQIVEDYRVADMARQRIEDTMDKASFRDTVGAWKIARDLASDRFNGAGSQGATVNIQVNATSGNVSLEEQ